MKIKFNSDDELPLNKTIEVPAITTSFLQDVNTEKVLVSKNISFGEKHYKYFFGYLHNDNKVRPLHIMLPKTCAYVKNYDEQTKWMYFLIEDEKY